MMFRASPSSAAVALCCAVLCCVSLCCVATEYEECEGESCVEGGIAGKLLRIGYCPVLLDKRSTWWKLKRYCFVGYEPVFCCVPAAATTTTTTTTPPEPITTTSPPTGPTTTEYTPPEYDYVSSSVDGSLRHGDYCPPLGSDYRTSSNTGIKSWDKCLEYQEQLIYPCEQSAALTGEMVRRDKCHHKADALIVGGEDASVNEFPHMVLLGYGQTNGSAEWKCGGTLISDRFILTAAHCTKTKGLGYVNYAIVGSLKRTDNVENWQVHRIKNITKHPEFNATTKKNDIALLETYDPIQLSDTTVPACLDVFNGNRSYAVATGWGATTYLGNGSDTLQKVTLTEFTENECRSNYPVDRHHSTFNSTTQVCYGDHDKISDTCQGDSGGPLTIKNQHVRCMYTVVGITSFGKGCGTAGLPGWYTRVAPFVPWIESIVWPS